MYGYAAPQGLGVPAALKCLQYLKHAVICCTFRRPLAAAAASLQRWVQCKPAAGLQFVPWPASDAMPLCCSPATQRLWPQPVGGGALGRSLQGAGDQQAAQTACAGRVCLCEVLVIHRQNRSCFSCHEESLRRELQLKLRVPRPALMSTPAAARLPSVLSKLPCCSHFCCTTYGLKHACIAPIHWTL